MHFYLDVLAEKNNIDLVYWDRDGKPDADIPKTIKNAYKFEAYLEEEIPIRKKMRYFYQYRRFALKVMKSKRYDFIIILHTTPGLTVLDYIIRRYKGRYILDFRDVSYESIDLYRKLVGLLARKSALTYVSSDAFRKYLPKDNHILTIHNYMEEALQHEGIRKQRQRHKEVISISYWGLIRHESINKQIIDDLGNDKRFVLHYYGRMQQVGRDLKEYAQKKGYRNVRFHGEYMPADRYKFAMETDLLHNMYECDKKTINAMGNKFYDGIIFYIPQLCTEGSYMGDVVNKQHVGYQCNMNDRKLSDKIWEYYINIDWEEFEESCKVSIRKIVEEQRAAKEYLLEVIENQEL